MESLDPSFCHICGSRYPMAFKDEGIFSGVIPAKAGIQDLSDVKNPMSGFPIEAFGNDGL
jgi:hypothetical protein